MRIVLHWRTRRTLQNERDRARALAQFETFERFQALLLLEHADVAEMAPALGYTERGILKWVALLFNEGPSALWTKRRTGRPPKLLAKDKQRLKSWVQRSPVEFGYDCQYWTCAMLQALLLQHTSVTYSQGYIAALLREFGCSWYKQEVVPDKADPEKQRIWRDETFPALKARAAQEKAVILYQDEVGFERTATGAYGWGNRRKTHRQKVQAAGGSRKLMGAIELETGKLVWHLLPEKKKGQKHTHRDFVAFLRQIAQTYSGRKVYLICDNGPIHHGPALEKWLAEHPNQLQLEFLPAYSPQFNPIERLWKKVKRHYFHGHFFQKMADLATQIRKAMRHYQRNPGLVTSLMQAEIRVRPQAQMAMAS